MLPFGTVGVHAINLTLQIDGSWPKATLMGCPNDKPSNHWVNHNHVEIAIKDTLTLNLICLTHNQFVQSTQLGNTGIQNSTKLLLLLENQDLERNSVVYEFWAFWLDLVKVDSAKTWSNFKKHCQNLVRKPIHTYFRLSNEFCWPQSYLIEF